MKRLKKNYIFEGVEIPQSFMDAVYRGTLESNDIRFEGTSPENWGDDISVTISGGSDEIFELYLKEWDDRLEVKR